MGDQGRTTFDKVLETILFHGVSTVYIVALEITSCTLFLSFWREDHFVMSFFPGIAFGLFCCTLVCFCICIFIDRVMGLINRCGDWYIYTIWTLWLVWMIVLAVPMIGYCVYSCNFMWTVLQKDWLQEEGFLFSPEFEHASVLAARIAACFVGVAIVEIFVLLMLDIEAC